MFSKILIANRGEIACRVIRTCRRLAIRTVAVHSSIDARALHVEQADEAYLIGGPRPVESYLRGDKIIEVAKASGAQAIHPGYGFLSENEDFARSVEAAGLVFIGPTPEAIEKMGLKDRAKAIMENAGVPVVPGYHGENQDAKFLREQAKKVGFPLLIKAVAGGGGKGMRLVTKDAEFDEQLAAARREERLRRRSGAPRAFCPGPAPHRVPGLRRHARQLRAPLRARVLKTGPPPEGARGNALAFPRRRDAGEDGRGRRGRGGLAHLRPH